MASYASHPAHLSGYGTGDSSEGPCCSVDDCMPRSLPCYCKCAGANGALGTLPAPRGGDSSSTSGPQTFLYGVECCCEPNPSSQSSLVQAAGLSVMSECPVIFPSIKAEERVQGKKGEDLKIVSPAAICGYGSCED